MGFGTRNGGPHKLLLVQRADNAAWPATRRPFIAAPRDLVVTGETTQSYRQPNPGSLWMYSHSGSTARNFVRIRRKATKSRTSSRGLQPAQETGVLPFPGVSHSSYCAAISLYCSSTDSRSERPSGIADAQGKHPRSRADRLERYPAVKQPSIMVMLRTGGGQPRKLK
jgi:hypothetical protein